MLPVLLTYIGQDTINYFFPMAPENLSNLFLEAQLLPAS